MAISATMAEKSFTHQVYHDFDELKHLRDAWDELAVREGDLFSSFDWCAVWWRHYGWGRHLEIHVVYDDDRKKLAGVFPLFREMLWLGGIHYRVLRLVGCDHALTPGSLAIAADQVEQVIKIVLSAINRSGAWDLIQLGPLRGYLPSTEEVSAALHVHAPVGMVILCDQENCATIYELPASHEEYLRKLAGSERRNIGRCERQLSAEHNVEVSVPQSAAEVEGAMDMLVQLHQQLWKAKGKMGQFRDWPEFEAFHRDMARTQAQAGRLLLVTLKVDGRTLGVEYGYGFGSRVHAMIRGYSYEDRWNNYSLGRMLHCQMLQQAIRRQANTMDDGRGAFEYKHRLGGKLQCERSVVVVRRGRSARVRFWLATLVAYMIHILYARIWFHGMRPCLRLRSRPLRRLYIRTSFLAQLFKRLPLPVCGQSMWKRTSCLKPSSRCPYQKDCSEPD